MARSTRRRFALIELFYDWTDVATFTEVQPPAAGKPAAPGDERYRSFLWRAIELELHGLALDRGIDRYRFRMPSDAVYAGRASVQDQLARVGLDLLSRNQDTLRAARRAVNDPDASPADLSKILYRIDPRLRVQRFRSHHFRETAPGGEVVRLSRGIPAVPFGPETVGRPALQKSVSWATRWLVEHVQPDGRFHYRYFQETDHYLSDQQIVEDYNEVRHGLATYSLLMSEREIPGDELRAAAEKPLRWILDSAVFGPAWTGDPARRSRLPSWVRTDQPFGPPGKHGSTGPADHWVCQHGLRREIPRDAAYVRINDSDMRTDFSFHTLSALNQTLRYMTDEELTRW
jgi:hypothetical protein